MIIICVLDQCWARLGMTSVGVSADIGFKHIPQLQFPVDRRHQNKRHVKLQLYTIVSA